MATIVVEQYTTTDEFQAQFGTLSYDATAYVFDTSLSNPQVVFASGGGVETCNLVKPSSR